MSDCKWIDLSNAMRGENAFLGGRISPHSLRGIHAEGWAVILEDDTGIYGFGALWPTADEKWRELGSLWIRPDRRDHKLSHVIFRKRLELLPKGVSAFIVSTKPKIIHMAFAHDFKEVQAAEWDEVPYAITCGPCDRFATDAEKRNCPFRAVHEECQLFVLRN